MLITGCWDAHTGSLGIMLLGPGDSPFFVMFTGLSLFPVPMYVYLTDLPVLGSQIVPGMGAHTGAGSGPHVPV